MIRPYRKIPGRCLDTVDTFFCQRDIAALREPHVALMPQVGSMSVNPVNRSRSRVRIGAVV